MTVLVNAPDGNRDASLDLRKLNYRLLWKYVHITVIMTISDAVQFQPLGCKTELAPSL